MPALRALLFPLLLMLVSLPALLCASPTQPAAAAPSQAELAASRCVIGEEAFVPGDYYYCLAAQSYGEGNYPQSRRFFDIAASWASKPAQFMLGLMAFNGDRQPVDRPLGLAWLALAAERRQPRFIQALAQARAKASAADWQAAQPMLAKLRPRYGDAKAAPRAEERYRLGMLKLRQTQAHAGSFCMAGMLSAASLSNLGDGGQVSVDRCPPVEQVVQAIDQSAGQLFEGWAGHVEVGALQQLAKRPHGH